MLIKYKHTDGTIKLMNTTSGRALLRRAHVQGIIEENTQAPGEGERMNPQTGVIEPIPKTVEQIEREQMRTGIKNLLPSLRSGMATDREVQQALAYLLENS